MRAERYSVTRRSIPNLAVLWAVLTFVLQSTPAAAAGTSTLRAVQHDPATRQGLLATGLLTTSLHRASKLELQKALDRFRIIYQDGKTEPAQAEILLIRSFYAGLESRFGLTLNKDHDNRHILLPKKLLVKDNSKDPTQSYYDSEDCCVRLYTYRWPKKQNPPQEMLNKVILKVTRNTIVSLRHSNREFAIRSRDIRHFAGGTEYTRHGVRHAFVVGRYIVGAYFTYLDTPTEGFTPPAYMTPQIAYWRRAAGRFTEPDEKARKTAIDKWVKEAGLTDQHASELKNLPPIGNPARQQSVDEMVARWAWRQTMFALTQVILKPFQDTNRLNTIEINGCHSVGQKNDSSVPEVYRDVRIVFATNRKYNRAFYRKKANPAQWFGDGPAGANTMNLGCVMVRVPLKESALVALAMPNRKNWLGWTKTVPDDDENLFRVTKARRLGQSPVEGTRYRLQLRDREEWKFGNERRALVFVHGYNTSFEYALLSTAQIAASMDYPGRVFLFSWPSNARFRSYIPDMDNAEQSEFQLAGFLRALFTDPELRKLDIVAHSMGSQILLRALDNFSGIFYSRHDISLGQVIFAAPDVSNAVFQHKIPEINFLADGITIYGSENDKALMLAEILRRQGKRLGRLTGSRLRRMNKVRYYDATSRKNICNLWGWFGIEHNYFTSNSIVRQHMSTVLTRGLKRTPKYASTLKRVQRLGIRRYKLNLPPEQCVLRDWQSKGPSLPKF